MSASRSVLTGQCQGGQSSIIHIRRSFGGNSQEHLVFIFCDTAASSHTHTNALPILVTSDVRNTTDVYNTRATEQPIVSHTLKKCQGNPDRGRVIHATQYNVTRGKSINQLHWMQRRDHTLLYTAMLHEGIRQLNDSWSGAMWDRFYTKTLFFWKTKPFWWWQQDPSGKNIKNNLEKWTVIYHTFSLPPCPPSLSYLYVIYPLGGLSLGQSRMAFRISARFSAMSAGVKSRTSQTGPFIQLAFDSITEYQLWRKNHYGEN